MCGRYSIISDPDIMRRLFGYVEQPNFPPRYNVAPTQAVPVVRIADGARHFALLRWGLLPSWVKDPAAFTLLINARAESAHEKPSFRNAMTRRRCLLPANGFYEWKGEGARKRPHYMYRRGGAPFAFAGLWETWCGPNGEEVESVAILTLEASPLLRAVHHRMPMMLSDDSHAAWLDCEGLHAKDAIAAMRVLDDAELATHEVSLAVNRVANDAPELIAPFATPVEEAPQPPASPRKPKEKPKDDRQTSLF